ncbi:MAG: hypothetical protein M9952_02690 [Microthrixaceae bacterium]|nr:hypothetical protein [Microthrixaceae bacterium]
MNDEDSNSASVEDDLRVARRDALKKAAAGAAVGGVVWAAPRVEGLSLVPNYASAGTATAGPITFVIESTSRSDGGGYYADSDVSNWGTLNGCDNGDADYHTAINGRSNPSVSISPLPASTQFSAITMSAPLGAAGNAVVTVPNGIDADLNANYTINVAFNIDPPWNKCRINAVTFNKCIPGPGPTSGTFTINNNPEPGATNPAPFTAGVTIGPQPQNFARMDITVQCS